MNSSTKYPFSIVLAHLTYPLSMLRCFFFVQRMKIKFTRGDNNFERLNRFRHANMRGNFRHMEDRFSTCTHENCLRIDKPFSMELVYVFLNDLCMYVCRLRENNPLLLNTQYFSLRSLYLSLPWQHRWISITFNEKGFQLKNHPRSIYSPYFNFVINLSFFSFFILFFVKKVISRISGQFSSVFFISQRTKHLLQFYLFYFFVFCTLAK